jgi:superfamily II DNA or RNA helicase
MKVCRSWGGDYEKNILDGKLEDIIKILDKKNDKYDYLDRDAIINAVIEHGEDQGIEELLTDEAELLDSDDYAKRIDVLLSKQVEEYKNTLTEILEKPRFPFSSQPREYQIKAYEAWVEADRQGLFAMATGTGKTITSLNCLLNEYQRTGNYQAIILVPSKVLLNQWVDEVNLFNFRNIMPASSDYKWREKLRELSVRSMFDADMDFIIIATYLTFTSADFQKFTNNLPPELVLIADEAHNLGANNFRKLLDNIRYQKRIGLSATPKRNYDEEGNLAIEGFFNSREPYTYSFTMDRAIKEGFLCRYKYYPHIIRLTEDEMEKYAELTVRLVQFFNNDKLKKNDAVERILLERKRIIHKAENKIPSFISILKKYQRDHGGLKYTFVYAPEGNDESGDSILGHYMREFRSIFPSLIAYPYTSNFEQKELVLENFEQGITDVLFAMKCLDEGVDVPRAELAIFCSSTGNPRQFIQRRGRVLRKHPDKDIAIIHDLVVVPERRVESDSSKMERNILKSEFSRVIYFASLSNNYYEAMEVCQEVADEYDVNIYALEDELRS